MLGLIATVILAAAAPETSSSEAAGPAAPASAAAEAGEEPPRAASQQRKKTTTSSRDEVVCWDRTPVGTRFSERVCALRRDLDDRRQRDQDMMRTVRTAPTPSD